MQLNLNCLLNTHLQAKQIKLVERTKTTTLTTPVEIVTIPAYMRITVNYDRVPFFNAIVDTTRTGLSPQVGTITYKRFGAQVTTVTITP